MKERVSEEKHITFLKKGDYIEEYGIYYRIFVSNIIQII